jgi:hypothetical protein
MSIDRQTYTLPDRLGTEIHSSTVLKDRGTGKTHLQAHMFCDAHVLRGQCIRRPHLNFISGENGSGKSATLQCLQVCLGARARDTGRSSSAKELVNYAASSATARVTLWNTVRPPPRCALVLRKRTVHRLRLLAVDGLWRSFGWPMRILCK